MARLIRTVWLCGTETYDPDHDLEWHLNAMQVNPAIASIDVICDGRLVDRIGRGHHWRAEQCAKS